MLCRNGFAKDDNGCEVCRCQGSPETRIDMGTLPCAMPMCAEPCENGYATDERGCMTCDCKEDPESLNAVTCAVRTVQGSGSLDENNILGPFPQ